MRRWVTLAAPVLECVVNLSEGRDPRHLSLLTAAAGRQLLDVHSDPDHHRCVLTLAGDGDDVEEAVRKLASLAVTILDVSAHEGAHPRLGALDVVPWVNLVVGDDGRLVDGPARPAVAARDRFAAWAAEHLGLPCFLYGDASPSGGGRRLPEVRRRAWRTLPPDLGPTHPHPTAGAVCVGARPALVAYNLWLAEADMVVARRVASEIRTPSLRTLALDLRGQVQVSCNLVDPWVVGPDAAYDAVAERAEVSRAELVGLVPGGVLAAIPPSRWPELDLDASRTIEARLEQAGLDGGRFDST